MVRLVDLAAGARRKCPVTYLPNQAGHRSSRRARAQATGGALDPGHGSARAAAAPSRMRRPAPPHTSALRERVEKIRDTCQIRQVAQIDRCARVRAAGGAFDRGTDTRLG